ncbi:hypothetical protein GCK32_001317 [Trichostrongylus colubriformis]|uniref:Phospholipase A(2) n=1 Tax=Trichostrongylus colubriformis TaxID=6319 RepID=A0AAN8EMB9_TRICO
MRGIDVALTLFGINYILALGIERRNWFCGTKGWVSDLSHAVMSGECRSYAPEVNHCCAKHDECYNNRRGRILCDMEFCKCLKKTSHVSSVWCQLFILGKCYVAHSFGEEAYIRARGEDRATVARIHLEGIEKFDDIYDCCPLIKKILTSCAMQYNFCQNAATNSSDCRRDLVECIDDGVRYNPSSECIGAVRTVFPTSEAEQKLSRGAKDFDDLLFDEIRGTRTLTILTASAIFMCTVISLVACLLYCQRERTDDQFSIVEERTTVHGGRFRRISRKEPKTLLKETDIKGWSTATSSQPRQQQKSIVRGGAYTCP